MYPTFFTYKFLTLSSYGIMLGLAFYCSFLIMERELKLKNRDPELAYKMLLVIIPGAIVGAKIFHIIDYFDQFLRNPMGMIFSGSGLSVLGGFVLCFILTVVVAKVNKESVLLVFDAASPAMATGYAIGRIGCHTSGDSCYGITTNSFLGTAYPNGVVPSTADVIPTPLIESFISFMIIALLFQLRKRDLKQGALFFIYLICMGIPRFSIEFFRTNPKVLINLSQAQLISIAFIIAGLIGLIYSNKVLNGSEAL